MSATLTALRGAALTFIDDPHRVGGQAAMRYESDAIVAMADGCVTHFGPASQVLPQLPPGTAVRSNGRGTLMLPGFIDCHVHYPQIGIIGAYGEQLLDWLDKYAFVAEQKFADAAFARETARVFLQQCLRAGTTTAAVFCTVHPQSVDAFFEESAALNTRMIAGKALMDRHAPAALTDTAQRGYDESKALIARWHGRGRQLYAITPRFAASSTPEQMDMAGRLWAEHPGTWLQSHVAENRAEVQWIRELYPDRRDYLDVYEHHRQLGARAIYGHGIWLGERELQRCHDTGTALAHCPTSNEFLGSGQFNLRNALKSSRPVRVGLGTDLGAGTSFSQLQTLNQAYKTASQLGHRLDAPLAFYLATRGGARALYLDDRVGSLAPGMEADLIVMDLVSTPAIEFRLRGCESLEEALFVQMTMGDDRAIRETWVAGVRVHQRL
ncbi:MAG TPA: guanine deaminase [Steroidobacteraceae bacterium]|nr:guanine deaminase [Steroidobacteraceae bacterium]